MKLIVTLREASANSGAHIALLHAFLRYLVVGGVAFAVDYGLLSLCLSAQLHYQVAVTVGFCGGLLINYALCVCWVWRGTQARSVRDLTVFVLIGLGGLVLTWLGMWICVDLLSFQPKPSKVLVAAIVLFWNFSLRRLFVFFR